jgi:hypothetical protein
MPDGGIKFGYVSAQEVWETLPVPADKPDYRVMPETAQVMHWQPAGYFRLELEA